MVKTDECICFHEPGDVNVIFCSGKHILAKPFFKYLVCLQTAGVVWRVCLCVIVPIGGTALRQGETIRVRKFVYFL